MHKFQPLVLHDIRANRKRATLLFAGADSAMGTMRLADTKKTASAFLIAADRTPDGRVRQRRKSDDISPHNEDSRS